MKLLIAVAAALLFLSFGKMPVQNYQARVMYADTSHIAHVLDGLTSEWPDSAFQANKETLIHYAADNDGQYLFLALRIADFRTQMKLTRQGMKLFIDLKGKKRQSRGIEYPIKPEGAAAGNIPTGTTDKKEIRAAMSFHLFAMKLFGFSDAEPSPQGIQVPGNANIAFNWDSSDVLHIEYFIPLNMLDDINSLRQKTISVGWTINGAELQTGSGNTVGVTSTSTLSGRPQGGGRNTRGPATASSSTTPPGPIGGSLTSGEESFWTKYTISF